MAVDHGCMVKAAVLRTKTRRVGPGEWPGFWSNLPHSVRKQGRGLGMPGSVASCPEIVRGCGRWRSGRRAGKSMERVGKGRLRGTTRVQPLLHCSGPLTEWMQCSIGRRRTATSVSVHGIVETPRRLVNLGTWAAWALDQQRQVRMHDCMLRGALDSCRDRRASRS